MAVHSFHRANCICRALDELPHCDIAEIAGGEIGQKRQTHVSRRRAMGDHGNGLFLIVVRRQPIIVRTNKGFEKAPCFPGNFPKKNNLVGRKFCFMVSKWPAEQVGDHGRNQPDKEERSGHCQSGRTGKKDGNCRDRGKYRGEPHGPEVADQVIATVVPGVFRWIPFKEPLVRNQYPPEGAPNRIKTKISLIGQADEHECCLHNVIAGCMHRRN